MENIIERTTQQGIAISGPQPLNPVTAIWTLFPQDCIIAHTSHWVAKGENYVALQTNEYMLRVRL